MERVPVLSPLVSLQFSFTTPCLERRPQNKVRRALKPPKRLVAPELSAEWTMVVWTEEGKRGTVKGLRV